MEENHRKLEMVTNDGEGGWLDLEQAAAYVHKRPKTLYNLKALGAIRGFNSGGTRGGKLMFTKADLDAYIRGEARKSK